MRLSSVTQILKHSKYRRVFIACTIPPLLLPSVLAEVRNFLLHYEERALTIACMCAKIKSQLLNITKYTAIQ